MFVTSCYKLVVINDLLASSTLLQDDNNLFQTCSTNSANTSFYMSEIVLHEKLFLIFRDSWCDVMPMITKREGLQAVSIDGSLFAMGGDNGISILNTMERYDPRIGYWTLCESMTYRRRYFGAAALRNQIVVLGGSDCDEDHNSVETYDMRMNRWLALPPLLVRRESPVAAVVGDRLFAIGGAFMNVETDSIDAYSVVDNKWEAFTPLPRAMEGMASAVL
jgi:hypothetical protein